MSAVTEQAVSEQGRNKSSGQDIGAERSPDRPNFGKEQSQIEVQHTAEPETMFEEGRENREDWGRGISVSEIGGGEEDGGEEVGSQKTWRLDSNSGASRDF